MTQQYPQYQQQSAPFSHKPPKRRRWPWILGVIGAFFFGLIVGAVPSGGTQPTAAPASTVTVPGATVTQPPATVTVPGPKVTETQKPPEATAVIEEGTWEVGVDVAPGRYKTVEAVDPDGMCYWKITTTGKPDNIVDNDIVSGGKPTVTVKKGQDFTTQGCGNWKKVA
jgi:hypothetical protein